MADSEENNVNNNSTTQQENPQAAVSPSSAVPHSEVELEAGARKHEADKGDYLFDPNKLGILSDVSILLTIEVGRTHIKIRDLLNLTKGSVLELDKLAGDPVDVYANGKLISTGNIITANGKYCVRLTSIPENNKLGIHSDGK